MRNLRALLVTLALVHPFTARAEVQIERTFLPEAHASSFAFGLPGGVNFCYDPVRGGVNYAWIGGFLDLTNVRPINKLITAATLLGPIVYRETGAAPLRRGEVLHASVVEFKGYTLHESSVELRYRIDGAPVSETITALPSRAGLRRTFHFDRAGSDSAWSYLTGGQPAIPLRRDVSGGFTLDVLFSRPPP